MGICAWILKMARWKVIINVPEVPKSIIVVAPHTSNWDFVLCILASRAVGRKIGFLMKESWFFFPLNILFKALGGIPVSRRKDRKESLTDAVIEKFNHSERLTVAITPEGTRSLTTRWHTGFLRIAQGAHIPIFLAALDFPSRTVILDREFVPTGDVDADMRAIKDYYRPFTGRYADRFTTED
ncbi:MAG: 1-acyl-sn-glycerol-3-phosphate acyltransferase [Duncaniella sp.]|nr:1-acyl-sn-glycerol-3-phosphate acyltransferase [Duncaniella sp.]